MNLVSITKETHSRTDRLSGCGLPPLIGKSAVQRGSKEVVVLNKTGWSVVTRDGPPDIPPGTHPDPAGASWRDVREGSTRSSTTTPSCPGS